MEEVEQRLFVPPSQMRYHEIANVPTTTARRESSWNVGNSSPSSGGITRIAEDSNGSNPHESLRREAISISRRSSVVPVVERSQVEVATASPRNGQQPRRLTSEGYQRSASICGETLRREALAISRRSSVQTGASNGTGSPKGYSMTNGSTASLPRNFGGASETDSRSSDGQQSNGHTTRISDETLEQLEKARLALEKDCFLEAQDGVSYLPDVVAQRLNNDNMALIDRVEKLEEVLATTRAQLEKAFSENRNLRALLSSENKLRELHVTKLRDEVEILRSFVFRHVKAPPQYLHQQQQQNGHY